VAHWGRLADKETDTEACRQKEAGRQGGQAKTQAGMQRRRQAGRKGGRHAGKEAHWGRLSDKETSTEAGRLQESRRACKEGRYANKEAGKQLEQKIKKKTGEQKDINTIQHQTKIDETGAQKGGKMTRNLLEGNFSHMKHVCLGFWIYFYCLWFWK
jgi:hypothetical protein